MQPGGRPQYGVDIVDVSSQGSLRAAQCKLHEEGKVTTRFEVEKEIEKAKGIQTSSRPIPNHDDREGRERSP